MNTWVYLSVFLTFAYPALWLIQARRASKAADRVLMATLEQQAARLATEHERSFMEGTRVMAEQYAAVQIEVERAREVAQAERDKTSRYFVQISNFEKQRTEWQELYWSQSIGHGNAQALMMQTIENLARALEAKGGRPQIPPVLHAVREEFLGTHEAPAREGMALLKQATVAQPSVETHPVAPEGEAAVAQSS